MDKKEIIKEIFEFSDEGLIDTLTAISTIREFQYGEIISKAGKIQKNIYFNISGIFRGFYIDENNNDITEYFGDKRGALILSMNAMNEESRLNMQAVNRLLALEIPFHQFFTLVQDNQEFGHMYSRILSDAIMWCHEVNRMLNVLSGKEKYLWFLNTYSNLAEYVRAKDIASFLHMTPVSLSRIRREIANESERYE